MRPGLLSLVKFDKWEQQNHLLGTLQAEQKCASRVRVSTRLPLAFHWATLPPNKGDPNRPQVLISAAFLFSFLSSLFCLFSSISSLLFSLPSSLFLLLAAHFSQLSARSLPFGLAGRPLAD